MVRGVITVLLLLINTLVLIGPMMVVALLKLLLPVAALRR